MAYFPFMIDISNQKCLVVGGGSIAFHKVKLLSDFDVHIKVVGTEICLELSELAKKKRTIKNAEDNPAGIRAKESKVEIVEREFQDSDIDGIDFVVAATDDEKLNDYISDLCRKRKILINVVDRKEACSFIFPAIIQNKDLLIAVSTGGQSPAAAAYVKNKIKGHIPEFYSDMVEELGGYRDSILKHVDSAKDRKEIFVKLLEYGDAHGGEIPPEIVKQIITEVVR